MCIRDRDTIVFRFIPGKYLFRSPYRGNETGIIRLSEMIETRRDDIESGKLKIRVAGFCSSFGSAKADLAAAKNRSNQVKSYFIVHAGLKEEHFSTSNTTRCWHDMSDVVAVAYFYAPDTLDIYQEKEHSDTNPDFLSIDVTKEESSGSNAGDTCSGLAPIAPLAIQSESSDTGILTYEDDHSEAETNLCESRFAVKTNVAYLAATVTNLGVEFAVGNHFSVDVPFIFSPYVIARDFRLQFLAVQPELRFWPGAPMKGHLFGLHLHGGIFNVAVDHRNRYQSPDGFYGLGLSYGYALPFGRHWGAEFTIGAGYVHTSYDTFYNVPNGICYKEDTPYNYWGLTKVGVSLIYRFHINTRRR